MPFHDPVTGDPLSRGEYFSWLVQGVIRRWAFLGVITLATTVVWITANPVALTWWNLAASYLALVIESVVGISMFNQTRRDAVIIRRIDALEAKNNQLLTRIDQLLEQHTPRDRIAPPVEIAARVPKRGRPKAIPLPVEQVESMGAPQVEQS